MSPKTRCSFAIGNALIALWMLALGSAIPIPHWSLTAVLVVVALAIGVSALLVFIHPQWADRSLRIAAYVLLGLGYSTLTVIALSVAFLAGVHGQFLRFGIQELLFASAVVIPYLVVYPWFLLGLVASGEAKPR